MVTRFTIRAEAEPAALGRVLDLFALRSLVPSAVHATCVDEVLEIVIDMPLLDEGMAAHLSARIANMIAVLSITAITLAGCMPDAYLEAAA